MAAAIGTAEETGESSLGVGQSPAGAKAISQIKSADAGGGGGGGGGGLPNLGTGAAGAVPATSTNIDIGTTPETQVTGNAVQAYVVSGDITSSQEAEAKLSNRRQISG